MFAPVHKTSPLDPQWTHPNRGQQGTKRRSGQNEAPINANSRTKLISISVVSFFPVCAYVRVCSFPLGFIVSEAHAVDVISPFSLFNIAVFMLQTFGVITD